MPLDLVSFLGSKFASHVKWRMPKISVFLLFPVLTFFNGQHHLKRSKFDVNPEFLFGSSREYQVFHPFMDDFSCVSFRELLYRLFVIIFWSKSERKIITHFDLAQFPKNYTKHLYPWADEKRGSLGQTNFRRVMGGTEA